jgi:hypothetical protein
MDDRCDDDDVFGCAVGGGRRRDGGGRPGGEKRRQATMVHEVALATKMIVRMLGDAGDEGIFPLVTEEQVLKWMVHVHLGFPTDSYQCSEVCSSFSCDVDKVCATPIGEMYHSYCAIFGEDFQKISYPCCGYDRDVLVSFLALLRVEGMGKGNMYGKIRRKKCTMREDLVWPTTVVGRNVLVTTGTVFDGQTDCVKTNRIRLTVVDPSAVRWLETVLDGQTDCVKTNRIRLSVVDPSAVRWPETVLDGQTDCVKTNRIRLSVVYPSAVRWLETALDGQTDCCVRTNRIRLPVINPSADRWPETVLDGQTDCVKTNRIRLSVVTPRFCDIELYFPPFCTTQYSIQIQ